MHGPRMVELQVAEQQVQAVEQVALQAVEQVVVLQVAEQVAALQVAERAWVVPRRGPGTSYL